MDVENYSQAGNWNVLILNGEEFQKTVFLSLWKCLLHVDVLKNMNKLNTAVA